MFIFSSINEACCNVSKVDLLLVQIQAESNIFTLLCDNWTLIVFSILCMFRCS